MVKKILIILQLLFIQYIAAAPNKMNLSVIDSCVMNSTFIDSCVMNFAESMPVFKGDLYKFIQKQIKYPYRALKDKIEGRVMVDFWVDKEGGTYNHEIIKGIRVDLDSEALRISKLIRFKKPAMSGGKSIKVKYTITILFKLPKNKK